MTAASASVRLVTLEALSGPADGRLLSITVAPHTSFWLRDAPEVSAVPLPAAAEASHGMLELELTGTGTLRILSYSGATPLVDEQAARRGTEIAAGQILRLGTTEFCLQSAGEAPQPEVGGITCPKCNALNPTEMRWCRGCGFELLPPGN